MLLVMVACANSEGEKTPAPTPDAAEGPRCGDGVCAASEIGGCSQDCGTTTTPDGGSTMGVCGDGTCNAPNETSMNGPGDCSSSQMPMCGNAVCEAAAGEDMTTCPLDCGGGTSTCPGGDDVGCFLCWFDPTTCIPPQTETICEQCLGLGP